MTADTSRPRWVVWLATLVAALALLVFAISVLVVALFQRSTRPEIVIDDPLQSTTIIVAIAGAVATPGTYELPGDSHVQHALDAAGGLRPDADLAAVNPAVRLQDGQQIIVPAIGAETAKPEVAVAAATSAPQGVLTPSINTTASGESVATTSPPSDEPAGTGSGESGLATIDVNTASADELDQLPGIGPVKAAAIVAYREEHGPFRRVDDLAAVDGISDTMVAELSPYIRADP